MSDFLKITRNGQILEIVLDRPKANAIDGLLSREMGRLFAEFRDDPALRVAILTGAGAKFFSAGWDLNAVAEGEEYLEDFGEGGFGGFPEMTNLLKPVICAVNGLAVGAGFEMLLRADLVIAAEHAQFMLPEVRIGMAPDVGTFMLPKLLPRQKALEILMTGRRFGAHELVALGLINEVVPRFEGRPGGYTRVIHIGAGNRTDNAAMAVLQLVGMEESPGTVTRPEKTARKRRAERRYAAAAKAAKKGRSTQPQQAAEPEAGQQQA